MADALISPQVGGIMLAASATVGAIAVKKLTREPVEKKIPLMGVMGAFIFAAQMINFSIPLTGSSGHIGGGMLLAALLGPHAGFLATAAVLLIQALFFADGGLLAFGCNLFNMGFFTCYLAFPLIYKPFVRNGFSNTKIALASVVSCIAGLQLGAFSVVLQTLFSGKTELPFLTFLSLMQPIHLAVGLFEGLITAAVLTFVWKARPEILNSYPETGKKSLSYKRVVICLLSVSIITGGGLALLASSDPDGLEWSIGKIISRGLNAETEIHEKSAKIQEKTAILPDYSFRNTGGVPASENAGTSASGLIGGGLTLTLLAGTGLIISAIRKRKKLT